MATNEREILKELLLADYQYRAEALRHSEQAGESRINFFVGLVTLLGAALVTLSTEEFGPKGRSLIGIWLTVIFITLLLGNVIFRRMLIRDDRTDECMADLDHIRQTFKDCFDDDGLLVGYTPVGGGMKRGGRDFGGLTDMMMVINSILVSALVACGVALLPIPSEGWSNKMLLVLAAVAGLLFAYRAHTSYVDNRREQAKANRKARSQHVTHAGAVVYTLDESGGTKFWLLPSNDQLRLPCTEIEEKGHLETALKEVKEKMGQSARRGGALLRNVEEPPRKYYLLHLLDEPEQGEAMPLVYDESEKRFYLPEVNGKKQEAPLSPTDKQLLTLAHQRIKQNRATPPNIQRPIPNP